MSDTAQKFLFGAATASHQVEGGNTNNWTEWEKKNANRLAENAERNPWPTWDEKILTAFPNPTQEKNYISGRACDHYHRFAEDFAIAKSLGHTAHRFSLEWSRIEPEEGKFDEKELAHYREVVAALRARGIEPFVTIWHWTLPLWLSEKGGVLARGFPNYFARYAETAVRALPDVRFWISINEPEIVSTYSYLVGAWPPQERSGFLYHRAMGQLIRAHRATYRRVRRINPSLQFGAVMSMAYFESAGGFLNGIVTRFRKYLRNFYFLDRIRRHSDFIGVNYYSHNRIENFVLKNKNEIISDMAWELYPEGIYHVLDDLKKYRLPIYITENGIADASDTKRARFVAEHVSWMRKAADDGVDVRGYLHWSLLDNFEWDKGFWPRFGLVEIDYKTLERKIRPSAFAYKKIIEAWDEK